MRDRLLGPVGFVLLVASAVRAGDPFADRVRALAHPRYAEREKAARELEAAGEPALKALRAAQASSDEELRARAAAVAEKIDRAVRSKRLLAAPTLALKFDRVPLPQAVAEVSQKTGLRFALEPGKDTGLRRTVTLDTGEVPLWEAVHAFYAAAGLKEAEAPAEPENKLEVYSGGQRMIYIKRLSGRSAAGGTAFRLVEGKADAPAATGRALRVRALSPGHERNTFDAAKGEVTFHLAVDAAPALKLQEVIGVEVRRATADDRRALAPAYPAPAPGSLLSPGDALVAQRMLELKDGMQMLDETGLQFPVTLKTGDTRPRRLAELEGVVVARVLAPPEPLLTVADVFGKGKGQTARADGLSCEVTAANPDLPALPATPAFGPGVRVRVPPRPVGTRQAPDPPEPAVPVPMASLSVRVTSTWDTATEVLNVPVQVRGRVQPFIRINRQVGGPGPVPGFEVRDADGKALRVRTTRAGGTSFDGRTTTYEVHLAVEKPARGVEGLSLTLTGQRPVVVEMPFVLKDVPLP